MTSSPRVSLSPATLFEIVRQMRQDIGTLYKRSQKPLLGSFTTSVTSGTASTSGSTTFPSDAGFTNAPSVFLSIVYTGGTDFAVLLSAIPTTTGFSWVVFTTTGTNSGLTHSFTVQYVALGR